MARTRKNLIGGIRIAWEGDRRGVIATAMLAGFTVLLTPVLIWLGKHLVDQIVLGMQGKIALEDALPTLVFLGLLGGGERALTNYRQNQQELFSRRVELHAMDRFLRQAASVDLGHYDNSDWYDRMARARRDVSWRPVQLATSTINLGASLIGVIGLAGLLASLHPLLVLLSLVSVLPWVMVQRRITRKIYEFHFDFTSRDREKWYYADLLVETNNAKDLRAFGLSSHFLEKHKEISDENYLKLARLYRRANFMAIGNGLLAGITLAAAYAFITKRGFDSELTPGDLTAAIAGFAALTNQASGISSALLNLDQHATFLEDYFAFLAIPRLIVVKPDSTPLPPKLEKGIVVRDLKFAYPNSTRDVLTGANLEVHPGELIALVGENGHGKTTLVNMLMRFYDPTAGSVSVDGIDLRDVDPSQLRSRIGVLFQDFSKFQLTLRENVALGRIDHTVEDPSIVSALAVARADHLREKLPNGLDSRVGRLFDGGQELSGGEWQRLALARMVFRDADIWILDEPTSNLDPEAEAAIFSELKQQLAGRIGIVISHRFSTVRVADRIYVIRDGRVLESGSHDELVALRGRYAELFELQASSYR